jgi:nucleoid DNA-binding protein
MIKQILQADAQCIREILLDGNDVYISDVGAIKIAYQHPVEERVGRNPYTGESLTIPYTPEYNKVTFTTNRNLKKELKEKTLGAAFVPDRNNKKKVKDAEEE